jgi:hypothetical protein
MSTQAHALQRLKKLIFSLGSVLLLFSTAGFVIMEAYIFTDVTENRLRFLDRTKGYRSDVFKSCISLRNMFLLTNETDPASATKIAAARSNMVALAKDLTSVHTQNYVSPPTQSVTDYFLDASLVEILPSPGSGLRSIPANFWGFTNDFINAIVSASSIAFSDLRNADYSLDFLSMNKRSVVFM